MLNYVIHHSNHSPNKIKNLQLCNRNEKSQLFLNLEFELLQFLKSNYSWQATFDRNYLHDFLTGCSLTFQAWQVRLLSSRRLTQNMKLMSLKITYQKKIGFKTVSTLIPVFQLIRRNRIYGKFYNTIWNRQEEAQFAAACAAIIL